MIRKKTVVFAAAAALFLGMLGSYSAAQRGQAARPANAKIHIEPVRNNIFMLAGSGANITMQVGTQGIMLVDAGVAGREDDVLEAVQTAARFQLHQLEPQARIPIRYLIDTTFDQDHIGGSWKIAASKDFQPVSGGEKIIAHGNLLNRMTTEFESKTTGFAPGTVTDAYFTDYYKLGQYFNGEGVEVIHVPAAHTDGDSIVWFRTNDVISASEILDTDRYPTIDVERGGNIKGVIDGLNVLLDMTYAEFRGQGGTMLVPAHGRLCYANDVAYFRDMVTIVRDRVQYLIDKKQTLDQVKAAKIAKDYDPLYGKEPGSSDKFIEAIYRSLTKKQ